MSKALDRDITWYCSDCLETMRRPQPCRGCGKLLEQHDGQGKVATGENTTLLLARKDVDLREIVSSMRVATDLERIGDLSKNIGKRVSALDSDFHPLKLIRGLEHMTDLVQSQVKSVLDA